MARRLLILNGVAILCVILFHGTGFGFTAMFAWTSRYRPVTSPNFDAVGTPAYYALRLVEQFVVFAIPAFLFVSGFFISVLTGRTNRNVPLRAVGSRIRSLLVPYLIWSGIVLLGLALQGRVFSESQYARLLLTGASNPNYYYVPMLIQLYLVAPIVVILARWNWKALLVATAVLQVLVYALQYPIVLGLDLPIVTPLARAIPKWLFIAHLFWFTFGVVTGFQHQVLKPVLERLRWPLLACTVVFFILGVIEWEVLLRWSGSPWRETRVTLMDGLYAGSLILWFMAAADLKLPYPNALMALGTRSYGIYLAHGVVMEYFSRGIYHFAPWILGRQALLQPMLIAVGLVVPLLAMFLVSRSPSRTLYPYVFG